MSIYFKNVKKYIKSEELKRYKSWLIHVIAKEGKELGEIGYIFVTGKEILEINRIYLNHNYITDVITFDETYLNMLSGEIYLCIEEVKKNAKKFEKGNILIEIRRNIIHGLLHMIGYDDTIETKKKLMKEKENFYLDLFEKML